MNGNNHLCYVCWFLYKICAGACMLIWLIKIFVFIFEDGFGHQWKFNQNSKWNAILRQSKTSPCYVCFVYYHFYWTGIGNKSIKCLVFDFSIRSDSQLFLFLSYNFDTTRHKSKYRFGLWRKAAIERNDLWFSA